jgi:CRP/FNR family cyclic AMP-dependent transcriptional regulator
MNAPELIGYLASLLVLVTFCMSGMVALRAVAIASNVAFIGYAALAGISPVLVLHALLLPMNVCRLLEAVRERRRDRAVVRGIPAGLAPTTRPTSTQSASEVLAQDEVTRLYAVSNQDPRQAQRAEIHATACADRRSERRTSRRTAPFR